MIELAQRGDDQEKLSRHGAGFQTCHGPKINLARTEVDAFCADVAEHSLESHGRIRFGENVKTAARSASNEVASATGSKGSRITPSEGEAALVSEDIIPGLDSAAGEIDARSCGFCSVF